MTRREELEAVAMALSLNTTAVMQCRGVQLITAALIAADAEGFRRGLEAAAKLAEGRFTGGHVTYCHAGVVIAAEIRAEKETP